MTQPLDTSILDRFESLAHALQRTVGIHPLQLTVIADMVAGACIIIRMVHRGPDISFFEELAGVLLILYVVYTVMVAYPVRRRMLDDIARKGGRNPMGVSPFMVTSRILILVYVAVYIANSTFTQQPDPTRVLWLILLASAAISLYFLSVTPLPSRRA